MGTTSFEKIKPDLRKIIEIAIGQKEVELDGCEKQIANLADKVFLYRVLELNSQSISLDGSDYKANRTGAMNKLGELGKIKINLNREIESLKALLENPKYPFNLPEILEDTSKSIMEKLTNSNS